MSLRNALLCSLLALGLVACDGPGPSEVDGGPGPGTDAGPPLTCTTMTELTGVLEDTVSATFDTRMTEEGPRDLGLACGNTGAELRWAPQEVVAFTVPGSAGQSVAVQFTSNVAGTDSNFNTVIQVRESCETVPPVNFPPACFNDIAMDEFRTEGTVTANGGDVLYFIITGFSEPPPAEETVDSGTVQVDFRTYESSAPTIATGAMRLVLDDVRIEITGNDPNADVRGVGMNFYGPDGELLDIFGDGQATEDGDLIVVRFDDPPATGFDYTGGRWVRVGEDGIGPLGGYLRAVGATAVSYRVFDAAWGVSDPLMVPITEATLVGLFEACDFETFCRQEMVCSGGMCIPSAQVAMACDSALDLALPPTIDTAVTVTHMGSAGGGASLFTASTECDPQAGTAFSEAIYKIDFSSGPFDLFVTSDLAGSGMTDTLIYLRSQCPDSGTELACNDDITAMTNLRSSIEALDLDAGTYYVYVETWGGDSSQPHEIEVTARPLIGSGLACDDAEVLNRCMTGTCTSGMCP